MKNKQLTIVIAAYNIAGALSRAVDSLGVCLNNDAVEILIINDGSTDGTQQIADQLSAKYTNLTNYHKSNGGLSSARNFGNQLATAAYITFMDGDDYLLPDAASSLMAALTRFKPDMLCFGYAKVAEGGTQLSTHVLHRAGHAIDALTNDELVDAILTRDDEPVAGYLPTKIIRHALISNLAFRDMQYEDMPFVFELMARHQLDTIYINQVLYAYVQRPESITHAYTVQSVTDKLTGLELVQQSLTKMTTDGKRLSANWRRSLISVLWLASVNRRSLRSGRVARQILTEYKRFELLDKGRTFPTRYLKMKTLFYYWNSRWIARKETDNG